MSKSGAIFSGLGFSARDIFHDTSSGMTTSHTPFARPSRVSLISGFGCIYVVWGTTYLGIRLAVADMPPFLMAAVRFLIAGGVLYGFLRLRGGPRPQAARWKEQSLVGLCLVGGNAVVCWAEQFVPSGLTALAVGTAPFFMVIFSFLMPGGTRPSRWVVVGLLLGLAGLLILFGPGAFPAGQRPPSLRVAGLFISSAAWCLGSVYSKHTGSKAAPAWTAAMQMLAGGAAMLVVSVALGEERGLHLAAMTLTSWGAFTYLTVVGSLIAFPTYIWLLKHNPPARVATYAYVNPVVAVLAGWLILGESLQLRLFLAVPVLIGGVVIITTSGFKTRNAPEAEDSFSRRLSPAVQRGD
jgi:drug/metabolite transporter (DMT)-like permease